jgi:O-antigen/teichoic acid export membrane protein
MSQNTGVQEGVHGAALARNTIINFSGLAIPLAVGFLTIPYVIRYLGTTRFGILSIVWIVFGYFGMFELGLGRTTTKYIAEALGRGEMDRVPGYFWTTVVLQIAVGALAFLALYLAAPVLSDHFLKVPAGFGAETRLTLQLVALSLPVNFVSSSFRGVLEAGHRFDLVNAVKIPLNVLFYGLPLIGALLRARLPGIVVMLILSRLLGLLFWAMCCFRVFPVLRAKPVFVRTYLRPLLSFSGWLALSGILYAVITSLDRLFIGNMVGMDAVGYYSAPFEAVSRIGIVPGSLALVLFPAFSFLNGGNQIDRIERIVSRSVKYLLILTGPLLLLVAFFSREILGLWLGPEFALRSTAVLRMLAVGFLVNSLVAVAYNYLQGIGRVDITTKFQILELLAYTVLMWAFVRAWGINGAALATAIRLAVFTFFNFWAAGKFGRIRLGRLWEGGTGRLVFLLLAYVAGLALCDRVLHAKTIGALALSAALVPAVYLLALEPEERAFLRRRLVLLETGRRP